MAKGFQAKKSGKNTRLTRFMADTKRATPNSVVGVCHRIFQQHNTQKWIGKLEVFEKGKFQFAKCSADDGVFYDTSWGAFKANLEFILLHYENRANSVCFSSRVLTSDNTLHNNLKTLVGYHFEYSPNFVFLHVDGLGWTSMPNTN